MHHRLLAAAIAALALAACAGDSQDDAPCSGGVGPECACVPACEGKACGDDGCGGSCGACAAGDTCTPVGTCQPPPSSSCAAGAWCTFERHVAWIFECTFLAASGTWDCRNTGDFYAVHGDRAQCDIECQRGNSSCGSDDGSPVVQACRVCRATCAEVDGVEACADEAPGLCPWPCACR